MSGAQCSGEERFPQLSQRAAAGQAPGPQPGEAGYPTHLHGGFTSVTQIIMGSFTGVHSYTVLYFMYKALDTLNFHAHTIVLLKIKLQNFANPQCNVIA